MRNMIESLNGRFYLQNKNAGHHFKNTYIYFFPIMIIGGPADVSDLNLEVYMDNEAKIHTRSGKTLKVSNEKGIISIIQVVRAIRYAVTMGARIMNLSLGDKDLDKAEVKYLKKAVNETGALLICAAGNSRTHLLWVKDNDINPTYPACLDNEDIIAVASIDYWGELSFCSHFGQNSVDLAACGFAKSGGYVIKEGTFIAAARVTMASALILSKYPDLSVMAVKTIILNSVKKIADLKDRVLSGGVLDTAAALKLADAYTTGDVK